MARWLIALAGVLLVLVSCAVEGDGSLPTTVTDRSVSTSGPPPTPDRAGQTAWAGWGKMATSDVLAPVLPADGIVQELRTSPGRDVAVEVLALDGGVLRTAVGPQGGPALRFPAWSAGEEVPRAVVGILPSVPDTGLDPLEPGSADFVLEVSFRQDALPQAAPLDDGDNLLQRGLASEPSQFKISVDHGRPDCRVAGSEGEVEVRARASVLPETWHRIRCERSGNQVVMTVSQLGEEGSVELEQVSEAGPIGELSWPGPTPVSVGGKLTKEGRIMRSATDQFSGVVAEPVLIIRSGDR